MTIPRYINLELRDIGLDKDCEDPTSNYRITKEDVFLSWLQAIYNL